MDKWEDALEALIMALKAAEANHNEGRPPIREVVSKLMELADERELD